MLDLIPSAPPVTEPLDVLAPKYEMIWLGLCMANDADDARCSYGFPQLLKNGVLRALRTLSAMFARNRVAKF